MDRRLVGLFVTLGLVAAGTAAVLLVGPPRIDLSQSPNEADRVTLYQNGLAAVSLVRNYTSPGGDAILVFSLPTSTIFDSVRLTGVTVKEFRSSLAASPVLLPGDRVVVHVGETQTYEGTLLSFEDGQLFLARDGEAGTVLVEPSKITAIEVKDRAVKPSGPGSTELAVLVDAAEGAQTVRLSYLAQGAGWTPNYVLDPTTGNFTFFATLTGLFDWKNVTLDLVSGSPNIVHSVTQARNYDYEASKGFAAAGLSMDTRSEVAFTSSAPLGDLHRYSYGRPISFARGETVRLALAEGALEMVRHYYTVDAHPSAGDLPVIERYDVRNTMGEPLPPGPVRLYIGGEWVGEDMLANTPVGERATITASTGMDLKARVNQTAHSSHEGRVNGQGCREGRDVYEHEVVVRNFRKSSFRDGGVVDLRVRFEVGSYRTNLLSADPDPDVTRGSQLEWNDLLGSGQSMVYRVAHEQLWC